MEIRDTVALVTGASMGIGLATAKKLAAAGASLGLAARSPERLQALARQLEADGCRAFVVQTDLRDRSQVKRMVDDTVRHFGRMDILVNNAGQGMAGMIEDAAAEDFQKLFELNVLGPLLAMQAAIPHMKAAGRGMIVNVSSMVSKGYIDGLSCYAATKAALNMISGTARQELESYRIKVSTVFPRMTATDFGANSIGYEELRRMQRSAGAGSHHGDSPDLVAEKILSVIRSEAEEQYMDR